MITWFCHELDWIFSLLVILIVLLSRDMKWHFTTKIITGSVQMSGEKLEFRNEIYQASETYFLMKLNNIAIEGFNSYEFMNKALPSAICHQCGKPFKIDFELRETTNFNEQYVLLMVHTELSSNLIFPITKALEYIRLKKSNEDGF